MRGDDTRAQECVGARLLVREQVEVALPVASLDVLEPVVRVGQRPPDLRKQLELGHGQRRLAAPRASGNARRPDHVAEVEVDRPGLLLAAKQLEPARAVDEVEEDELPHVAPRKHAPRDAALLPALLAGLELLGLGAHARDLDAVRKPLRQGRHGARV